MSNKIVMLSDVHLCQGDWYNVPSEVRMEKMIADLNASYQKEPYDAIFFLGDYSLDHWVHGEGGSWLHHGISNTKILFEDYLPRLECPVKYMIPGNHEQFGNQWWREATGNDRQFSVFQNGYLFIMLDTFGENLDPTEDSDGTYKPVDVEYIKTEMAKYPDAPVLLCSHFFAIRLESEEFKELVKNEKRILALFCGHDHQHRVEAHASLGGKLIIHDGHFSYAGFIDPTRCPWGWLELRLMDEGVVCTYVYPSAEWTINENPYVFHGGEGPMLQITREPDLPFPRLR